MSEQDARRTLFSEHATLTRGGQRRAEDHLRKQVMLTRGHFLNINSSTKGATTMATRTHRGHTQAEASARQGAFLDNNSVHKGPCSQSTRTPQGRGRMLTRPGPSEQTPQRGAPGKAHPTRTTSGRGPMLDKGLS
eukprot:gene7577-731_t